jgi:catechol 2,3-dioxygenase-like lactoylglutathione lyase family enzyme
MAQAKLAFFKLIVRDLERMRAFYCGALGFAEQTAFDTPDFRESILRQDGTDVTLILLCYKDGRTLPDAAVHGPTGFLTEAIEATHAALIAAGARAKGPVMEVEGGIKVAFLDDPEGHEIELCQFP